MVTAIPCQFDLAGQALSASFMLGSQREDAEQIEVERRGCRAVSGETTSFIKKDQQGS